MPVPSDTQPVTPDAQDGANPALEAAECPEPAPDSPEASEAEAKALRGQDQAIARLFAAGQTYSQIAETLRISRSTVARRLADPKVKQRVRALADQRVADVVNDLNGAAPSAVLTLQRVMVDPKASDATKVRAADAILQHLGRFTLRSPHDPITAAEAREALVVRLQEMARRKFEGTPLLEAYLDEPETTGTDAGTEYDPNEREEAADAADTED